MKSKNNTPARLLTSEINDRQYKIFIRLGNTETVEMIFTDKFTAEQEFNRLRSSSIYAGKWIREITLNELSLA